jgi:hypothetical protein
MQLIMSVHGVGNDGIFTGGSWIFLAGDPDSRGAAGAENSRAEGSRCRLGGLGSVVSSPSGVRGGSPKFSHQILQISGVHLIVPGFRTPDPPAS